MTELIDKYDEKCKQGALNRWFLSNLKLPQWRLRSPGGQLIPRACGVEKQITVYVGLS